MAVAQAQLDYFRAVAEFEQADRRYDRMLSAANHDTLLAAMDEADDLEFERLLEQAVDIEMDAGERSGRHSAESALRSAEHALIEWARGQARTAKNRARTAEATRTAEQIEALLDLAERRVAARKKLVSLLSTIEPLD